MKRLLLFTCSLLLIQITSAFAQDISTDITGKKMADFIKIEKKLKGKIHTSENDIIIPGGMEAPVMYRRVQKGIPDLIVSYTFTKQDSSIHEVQYSWNPANFENADLSVQPISLDKMLVEKYIELLTALSKKYGPSKSEGDLTDLQKIDSATGLERSDAWVTKDLTNVRMSIILANQYKFRPDSKSRSLHMITIYVDRKKQR